MIEKLPINNEYNIITNNDQNEKKTDIDDVSLNENNSISNVNNIEFDCPDSLLVKNWDVRHRSTIYYALRKDTLLALMKGIGLNNCRVLKSQESGFYQPMFLGYN